MRTLELLLLAGAAYLLLKGSKVSATDAGAATTGTNGARLSTNGKPAPAPNAQISLVSPVGGAASIQPVAAATALPQGAVPVASAVGGGTIYTAPVASAVGGGVLYSNYLVPAAAPVSTPAAQPYAYASVPSGFREVFKSGVGFTLQKL